MKLLNRLGLDKTRGQIFAGFIVMMTLVLSLTAGSLYFMLSRVQKENTALYIDEIAVQVSGRLESLLSEINVLTLELAMDDRIQERLEAELQGQTTTYDEKMQLRKILIDKMAYSETIREIELFSEENSLYPIVDQTIQERLDARHLAEANEALRVGALVWVGHDPNNPEDLLAFRRIKLEKWGYQGGGYLVVRIRPSLVEFISKDVATAKGSKMRLLDAENNEISSSNISTGPTASKNGTLEAETGMNRDQYVMVQRKINSTDWQIEILIPKQTLTKDFYFLKDILIWASAFSIVVFAFLSYSLSQLITLPMKKLARVMQQGKKGHLAENPEVYFNNEVNLLNVRYNQMVRQINYLIESVYEKELLKSRSEIKALHSQIHPHFLFNTLDSLYWEHVKKEEGELAQMVIQLADLFRYSIQASSEDGFVTVEEELGQVMRYVSIMSMRWRDRLEFVLEDDLSVHHIEIPKLMLQPLVENAIVHGIEPLESGGRVELSIQEQEDAIAFVIKDNGIGIEADKLEEIRRKLSSESNMAFAIGGKGIGLFNVNRLIQFHYGVQFGITIDSCIGKGTRVELRIPGSPARR